ncbi:MAG: type II secretion system protein [Verrucomicrobiota bacterium]|nr:type II secretion system protein [Verrucomicrobiota bacterium]MDP7177006.1 type II secretion system protein [Verrucomicrobiota bacterium]MDP7291118.1 type II secretion system protein [Verrucomicrobiota bacterium]HJN82128.1 type II secretion system protein [Verrucomicrobiota bacterium]|tara:strand:+ start:7102 stop:7959 length:858 start_codon:yes stop_codon:yes gene_type:complete
MTAPPASSLAKRRPFAAAFTVLEVMLAIVIATGLLATAMYYYQQAARFRNDLLEESERIGSARLILDRLSTELRCSLHHPVRGTGVKGGTDWIEFLKSSVPSLASWRVQTEGNPPPYPETGYRLVRYELVKKPVLEGPLDNTANQQMVERMATQTVGGSGESDQMLVTLMQGDAINRTERRLLTAKLSTNTVVAVRIDPVRITDQLKYLKFRYLNNGAWVDSWSGPRPPLGVEVSLGIDPMSATNLLEEYTNHVFRRIIRIPALATPPATASINEVSPNAPLITP